MINTLVGEVVTRINAIEYDPPTFAEEVEVVELGAGETKVSCQVYPFSESEEPTGIGKCVQKFYVVSIVVMRRLVPGTDQKKMIDLLDSIKAQLRRMGASAVYRGLETTVLYDAEMRRKGKYTGQIRMTFSEITT